MTNDTILNKLESLRRCIERVEAKTPDDLTELLDDHDLQDIIVLNLERAVQLCVDIGLQIIGELNIPVPESMAKVFRVLAEQAVLDSKNADNLARAVGFRNTAVHAYQKIDWQIVYAIATRHLGDFRTFANSVLAYVDSQ
ncbi:MAG: type VII toxin-antitoxin system HepT family RNase toxin [Verrucomicrobiota bacterium]